MAISIEQAAAALIANGYFFDESYSGPGIRLHNDDDLSFVLYNGTLEIAQCIAPHGKGFYAAHSFDIICKYALADCSIAANGELQLCQPNSKRIESY